MLSSLFTIVPLAAFKTTASPLPVGLILGMIVAVIVLVLMITFAQRYRRCPANKILVVYGKTGSGAAKCIHGGAAFIWPLFQAYEYLDLEPFVVPIDLSNALSQENIRVTVPTTVTAAVSNQPGIMQNAAIRLLGLSRDQIQAQAQDIILGQMRAVIATMKIGTCNSKIARPENVPSPSARQTISFSSGLSPAPSACAVRPVVPLRKKLKVVKTRSKMIAPTAMPPSKAAFPNCPITVISTMPTRGVVR